MSTRLSKVVFAAALASLGCFALVPTARAQTNAQRPPQQPPAPAQTPTPLAADAAVADADLAITARVTARELRFEKAPNTKVEFTGKPRRETLWQTERENLPEEVRPGVTYRDIGIRLRITSVFADIDRIVAEALGERPVTDDPQPAPQQQNQPQPQSTPPSTPPEQEENVAPQASLQGSTQSATQVTTHNATNDATPSHQLSSRPQSASRASLTSPGKAPATNKATRQRRGTTRTGRQR